MNETGMITLMSSKQQDAWEKQLHSDDMPEITLETVIATFAQLNASKSDTFEQGVIDVFRALSWDYKTNNPCRLGKKIIVSRLLETWGKGYTKATCSSVAKLDDLAKPFYVLEGNQYQITALQMVQISLYFMTIMVSLVKSMKGNIFCEVP